MITQKHSTPRIRNRFTYLLLYCTVQCTSIHRKIYFKSHYLKVAKHENFVSCLFRLSKPIESGKVFKELIFFCILCRQNLIYARIWHI
jgi:hypothetical protein